MAIQDFRLTRDGICRMFKLSPERLEALEGAGVLTPEADGLFDVPGVAAALFHFGTARADAADRRIAAVATTLREVLPALERLAGLPDRVGLEGEARQQVLAEISAFFTTFAGLMNAATAALSETE